MRSPLLRPIRPAASLVAALALALFTSLVLARADDFGGLHYEIAGHGESIVFLHGGQMDRRVWDAQFPVFAKHHQVVRYDLRGFGRSPAPLKPYSPVEDLRGLLDHLKIRRAVMIGLSLGAATAVDFALTYPDRVEALILTCPGLGGFPFQDKANDLRAVVDLVRDDQPEKAAELWLANPYCSVAMEKPALRGKLRLLARENTACWINNPLLLRPTRPAAAERLREIRAPTLAIDGERDVADIHKIVDKLATEIPGAHKQVVTGAGHLVPMETPEEFNALATEFLASVKERGK